MKKPPEGGSLLAKHFERVATGTIEHLENPKDDSTGLIRNILFPVADLINTSV